MKASDRTEPRESAGKLGVREITPVFSLADDRSGKDERFAAVLARDLFEESGLFLGRKVIDAFERCDNVEALKRRAQQIAALESGVWKRLRLSAMDCYVTDINARDRASLTEEGFGKMALAATELENTFTSQDFAEPSAQNAISEPKPFNPPRVAYRIKPIEICRRSHWRQN